MSHKVAPNQSSLVAQHLHSHDHLSLSDETNAVTLSITPPPTEGKLLLLDIACGSISGLVNLCVGHPIE